LPGKTALQRTSSGQAFRQDPESTPATFHHRLNPSLKACPAEEISKAAPSGHRGLTRRKRACWTAPAARRKRRPHASNEAALPDFATIEEDFGVLPDWEDRYRYIIELGRTLEPLADAERNAQTKVSGCVSQVWILSERQGDAAALRLHFRGDSDSTLVKGLVAIAFSLFNDHAPGDILRTDAIAAFASLGLEQHLTPQRSNGVRSMIARIKADAARAEAAPAR
jgi:cysteine desulfuration protein SufE